MSLQGVMQGTTTKQSQVGLKQWFALLPLWLALNDETPPLPSCRYCELPGFPEQVLVKVF